MKPLFRLSLLVLLLSAFTWLPVAAQDEQDLYDIRESIDELTEELEDFSPPSDYAAAREYHGGREDLDDFIDSGRLKRLSGEDLEDLADILDEIEAALDDLTEALSDDDLEDMEDDLDTLEESIDEALEDIETALDKEAEDVELAREEDDRPWWQRHPWFRNRDVDDEKDVYMDDTNGEDADDMEEWEDDGEDADDDEDEDDRGDRHWSWDPTDFEWRRDVTSFVGDYGYRWPFHETALYRNIPPVRYNRVDGLAIGIGLRPLDFDEWERAKLIGQGGYAFGSERWFYQIGAEVRATPRRADDYGLKFGGFYQRQTATNDLWKSSWLENSLAAFLFEYDFFDYYEVQGYQFYAVQRLSRLAQLSAGFRSEEYRSLTRNVHWSLFGGHQFQMNPGIEDSDPIKAFLVALDGGKIRGFHSLPSGYAFRAEAELADGFDNPWKYNRFVGDVRAYLSSWGTSSLGLRVRGGYTSGDVPFQRMFTLGGIGSVRGYPQNGYAGSRMLLGNAEYMLHNRWFSDDFLDNFTLIGFFDAGWVNTWGSDEFRTDDLLTSAGLGLGFNDRTVRLELAFPLRRTAGMSMEPSLWFRISPSF